MSVSSGLSRQKLSAYGGLPNPPLSFSIGTITHLATEVKENLAVARVGGTWPTAKMTTEMNE